MLQRVRDYGEAAFREEFAALVAPKSMLWAATPAEKVDLAERISELAARLRVHASTEEAPGFSAGAEAEAPEGTAPDTLRARWVAPTPVTRVI